MNDDTLNDKRGGTREREDILLVAYDSHHSAIGDSSSINGGNDHGLLPPIASASKQSKSKKTVQGQMGEDDQLAAAIFMTSRSCQQQSNMEPAGCGSLGQQEQLGDSTLDQIKVLTGSQQSDAVKPSPKKNKGGPDLHQLDFKDVGASDDDIYGMTMRGASRSNNKEGLFGQYEEDMQATKKFNIKTASANLMLDEPITDIDKINGKVHTRKQLNHSQSDASATVEIIEDVGECDDEDGMMTVRGSQVDGCRREE